MARRAARSAAVSRADALRSRWRAGLALVLAAMLAPVIWLRQPLPPPDSRAILEVEALPPGREALGPFAVEGFWHLDSPNSLFGSYSALAALPGDTLFAASDSGAFLRFAMPTAVPPAAPFAQFGRVAGDGTGRKRLVDIEALTRDPETGQLWFAYEGVNLIERRDADLGNPRSVSPEGFGDMGSNSGAESLVRLADGRFVVLAEGARRMFGNRHLGFLFAGDPTEGAVPERFLFEAPEAMRPVDMAQLPDGRVLVLLRRLVAGLPPGFESGIALADPADIRPDGVWRARMLATITGKLMAENYEGLAIVPRADGKLTLWIIADDNNATLQRTLLLKLRLDPAAIR